MISVPSNENGTTRPECIPIKPSTKHNHLPSSAINKRLLVNPNVIILKYSSYLKHLDKIPTLARKLAEKCFFGADVLKLCTVAGQQHGGESMALPLNELNKLKSVIFSLLPQYWSRAIEFEDVWVKCTVSIGQLCKTIR